MLHYYQCQQCLSIGTNEIQIARIGQWKSKPNKANFVYWANARCNACQGDIWYLGAAREDKKRLEGKIEKTACDKRCTHATGPVCVCQCGCKNHGKGTVIEILTDLGPVPEVKPINPAKAVERANAVKGALNELKTAIESKISRFKSAINQAQSLPYGDPNRLPHALYRSLGQFLSLTGWNSAYAGLESKVWSEITDHDNRLKTIRAVADKLSQVSLDLAQHQVKVNLAQHQVKVAANLDQVKNVAQEPTITPSELVKPLDPYASQKSSMPVGSWVKGTATSFNGEIWIAIVKDHTAADMTLDVKLPVVKDNDKGWGYHQWAPIPESQAKSIIANHQLNKAKQDYPVGSWIVTHTGETRQVIDYKIHNYQTVVIWDNGNDHTGTSYVTSIKPGKAPEPSEVPIAKNQEPEKPTEAVTYANPKLQVPAHVEAADSMDLATVLEAINEVTQRLQVLANDASKGALSNRAYIDEALDQLTVFKARRDKLMQALLV